MPNAPSFGNEHTHFCTLLFDVLFYRKRHIGRDRLRLRYAKTSKNSTNGQF